MDGDVIDFNATLDQEFFDITAGASVPEVPADGEHDYFGREAVAREGGTSRRR